MDDIDRQLLIHVQKEIPFQLRPFEALGKKTGLDSAEVILRIHRLLDEKVIRPIGVVFDTEKISYQSTLAAFKVTEQALEAAAAVVCRHPGVPLCCKRQGEFNLWFMLALPIQESLEEHGVQLQRLVQAQKAVFFKTLKVYKPAESLKGGKRDLTEEERTLVQLLQEDFPLTDEPFRKWAQRLGIAEEELFRRIQRLQKEGFFKRIAVSTAFRERAAKNALVMWQIPEEKLEAAGASIAAFPEVQSCIRRTASEDFPYSLHAMIEGVSEELLKKIEQKIGLWPSQCFLKVKDFKKEKPKYFSEEISEWRNHFIESEKVRIYESA